jgi:cystathionine beta-lyase
MPHVSHGERRSQPARHRAGTGLAAAASKSHDFDTVIDRRRTDSEKWRRYGDGVLPLWVADMDFRSPEPVIQALQERVAHGVFGYGAEPGELRAVIVERLSRLYGWQVSEADIVFAPGVVTGFNLACRAVASPGEGVLMQTPVYPPILAAPLNAGLQRQAMELTRQADGRYTIDFEAFERTVTADTRLFILCNPHNPVGRAFSRDELMQMAQLCLRHKVVICSDEIHCDLLLPGTQHIPIAALDPEVAAQTITLMAPSKTFNIAGLQCAFAVIQNPDLRRRFVAARGGLAPGVNLMGFVAGLAAYRDGQTWLDDLLDYLAGNLDYLMASVGTNLPGIHLARPEATTLAWLDCRHVRLPDNPHRFFLQQARVAVNAGAAFGPGGEGFVRLNFGCPRALLAEALERMSTALKQVG